MTQSIQNPKSKIQNRTLVFLAILAALTVLSYAHVFTNPFVAFDDGLYVTDNPRAQQGLTLDNVAWAFTTNSAANWHPLTWISHMIDVNFFGLNPRGHHLVNLFWHVVNSALVFLFLKRATGSFWRSAFISAVFALHPIHVESVAWISERKDLLSGFFAILALIAYTRYLRAPSLPRYLLIAVLFALGLLAKPMIVTLPCVMLLLDYWPFARFDGRRARGVLKPIAEKLPLLALSALSGVITIIVQNQGGAVYSLRDVPFSVRLENAPVACLTYIAKTLFPFHLAVFYPLSVKGLPLAQVFAAIVCLAAITTATLLFARRYPYLATGWFWFLGMLAPVIGIIQFGDQALADRYMYLPIIGLLLIATWGGSELLARWPAPAKALCMLVIVACIPLTFIQTAYWRDTMTLWQRAADVTPVNKLAHYNLGCGYLAQKDFTRAAEHFSAAIQADPADFESITNLGVALASRNETDKAIQLYYAALTIKPDHVNAQINLATALAAKGQYDEALRWLNDALHIEPNNADIHYNLGFTRYKQGQFAEAERSLLEALRLRPDYVEAGYCLGLALMHEGHPKEAANAFSNVLKLQPEHADARRELERLQALP